MQDIASTVLDKIDKAILKELQLNGRLSNVQLADKVGLSESACLRRVRMLEETGIIDRYVMLVNQAAIGKPGNVFVRLTLDGQQREKLATFEEAVQGRITSYNVCYTKLLRLENIRRFPLIADFKHFPFELASIDDFEISFVIKGDIIL